MCRALVWFALRSGDQHRHHGQAYQLLKAILNTAVDDGIIRRNPCRIKGAGQERSDERPVLTIAEVYALAEAIDLRYRALVLLGTFASLRWAELAALRPRDVDLGTCTIRVERQLVEQLSGGSAFGPPKSRAGRRTVPFSDLIEPDLAEHLARLDLDDDQALVFTSPMGTPYDTATSTAASGCPHWSRSVCPVSISTTCVMPGILLPLMRARACAS